MLPKIFYCINRFRKITITANQDGNIVNIIVRITKHINRKVNVYPLLDHPTIPMFQSSQS